MFIDKNKTKICGIVISIAAVLIFESCSPTTQSGYGPSSKTDNNNNQSDPDQPSLPSDVSTTNQFFVTLDTKTTYPYYVSRMSSLGVPQYGSKCAVDKSSSSTQNLTCIIEAPELSLWYGGLQMAVNIPAGMCEYMREVPYWYYNNEVGVGPTAIGLEVTTTTNAAGKSTNSYRCSVNGSSFSDNCSGYDEANFIIKDGTITPKCIYDKTGSRNGKNCCFGGYSLTTIIRTVDASGTVTENPTYDPDRDWAGQITDCIGGQGKTNWDTLTVDGYPISRITEVRSGVLKPITVKAPSESIHGAMSVIPVANYYSVSSTVSTSLHYHTGYASASAVVSNLPYYVDPISDRDGTLLTSAYPAYEYHCLGDAFEVKHKIKLYVRQWDVLADFNTYISTGTYTGSAPWDYSGTEGTNCNGVTDPNEPCDDFKSSDNIPRGLGGSYTGSRYYYFPNNNY